MATFATLPLALSRLIDPSPTASHRRYWLVRTTTNYGSSRQPLSPPAAGWLPVRAVRSPPPSRLTISASRAPCRRTLTGHDQSCERTAQPIRQHPNGRIPMHTRPTSSQSGVLSQVPGLHSPHEAPAAAHHRSKSMCWSGHARDIHPPIPRLTCSLISVSFVTFE
jgi:hypothetical protein